MNPYDTSTPQPGPPPQPQLPYGAGGQPRPGVIPYGPPANWQQQPYNQPAGAQQPINRAPSPYPSQYNGQYAGPYNGPVAAGYGTNPHQQYPTHKPAAGKRIALIGGGLLLLLTIVTIVVAGGNDGDAPASPQTTVEQTADPALADISSRPDGVLDLSKKVTVESSLKAQSIEAKIKEQVNLSSGFSFLIKAAGTYESPSNPPTAGKKFIIVQIVTGNRAAPSGNTAAGSTSDDISLSYLDYKLRAKDNSLVSGHPATQQIPNNVLASPSALKSGEQIEGRIIYEVDAGATDWLVVHKETYQKSSDGTTFSVEGGIAISIKPEAPATSP